MYRKPVGWINASNSPTGAADAHASLRKVLGYLSTDIVEAASVHIPTIRTGIVGVLAALAEHVTRARAQ
jgi:hypothetical protein